MLNNLAYSLVQLKNPEALEIAIRAVQLSPWSSTFLDTLAAAYSASDQTSRAVKVQLKAVALSPQVGAYRLQLARYQIAAGAKQEARQMLETLAGRGADAGVDAALLDDLLRQSRQ